MAPTPTAVPPSICVADIAAAGGAQGFADIVVRNQQLTSTRGGVSKAEAVLQAASALVGVGVNTASELRERAADETVMRAWLAVHGQGSGVSWHYVTMLALVDDAKPDRMVLRFISRAVGRDVVDPAEARAILVAAHVVLVKEFPALGLRALDYVIWDHEAR